ncbi:unnamed protein product, partial [Linum tenue]
SLKQLRVLDLWNNHFAGELPECLSNLTSLQILDLSDNRFTGDISLSPLGSLMSISELRLTYNSFKIPFSLSPFSNLSKLQSLKTLRLDHNQFQGSIPIGLSRSPALNFLDVSNNDLSGTIPSWLIDKMYRLRYILLNNNSFQGEMPIGMCKLEHLRLIDLSTATPAIEPMEITTKAFPYSYQGRNLLLMSGINLSGNNFTGEIPEEFGNLTSIKLLNLSHNALTGSIPSTFSKFEQIESLDLCYNNLTGSIPAQLVDLNSLAVFSVAYNNLSGRTPERVAQFATFNENCYDGNPFLCGWPLPKKCTPGSPPQPSLPTEDGDDVDDGEVIDTEVFVSSFTVSFGMVLAAIATVLYINPNWRRRWFYYVEMVMEGCYYFMVDHLPVPEKYKVLDPSSGRLSWQ